MTGLNRRLSSTLDCQEHQSTRILAEYEIFILLSSGMECETCALPVLCQSLDQSWYVSGSVSSSMTKEWMTAGSALKKGNFVFAA